MVFIEINDVRLLKWGKGKSIQQKRDIESSYEEEDSPSYTKVSLIYITNLLKKENKIREECSQRLYLLCGSSTAQVGVSFHLACLQGSEYQQQRWVIHHCSSFLSTWWEVSRWASASWVIPPITPNVKEDLNSTCILQ